jgi:hypothetical protein
VIILLIMAEPERPRRRSRFRSAFSGSPWRKRENADISSDGKSLASSRVETVIDFLVHKSGAVSPANPPTTTQSLLAVPPHHLMPPDVVLLANSSSPHKAKDIGKISDTKPSSLPASLEAERALLWQRAYEEVRKENATLVSNYEAILASVSDVDIQDAKTHPLPNQLEAMQHVVDFQQQRMLNKQWTWSMFGSNTKIRDTVDGIMKLVVDSSALISVGMTLAPPYVSLPWSAISALIPVSRVLSCINREVEPNWRP